MSYQLEEVDIKKEETCHNLFFSAKICHNNNKYYPRHVLKSKNHYKPKCSRALKRKLKKYKLRKDGQEDPDVIDVSQSFSAQLKIRSPHDTAQCSVDELEPRPTNYLFKMGRKKQTLNKAMEDTSKQKPIEVENVSPVLKIKKQTNAFKLMMDSRNKSIGSNSPGKEKNLNPSDEEEFVQKKNLKVKRNLALQKMAEAKGSLNRIEKEQLEEECVKQKMEQRADRLKSMISKVKTKRGRKKQINNTKTGNQLTKITASEDIISVEDSSVDKPSAPQATVDVVSENKDINQTKVLKLVDMFCLEEKSFDDNVPKKKLLSKEDQAFLDKLSPSLKKKENMLCYFNKVEKSSEVNPDQENVTDLNPNVIKVKLTPRRKSKSKRKKLSLGRHGSNETLSGNLTKQNSEENIENVATDTVQTDNTASLVLSQESLTSVNEINERRKRKRKNNISNNIVPDENVVNEGRPKRNLKKPLKYIDDVQISSSDDELHIFTPKKRKQQKKPQNISAEEDRQIIVNISDEDTKDSQINHKKRSKPEPKMQKKSVKLAPIFNTKPQLTAEELEAKQKFLQSGIPEKLKRVIDQQKKLNAEIENVFPIVVHVQQIQEMPSRFVYPYFIYQDNVNDEEVITNNVNIKTLLNKARQQSDDSLFSVTKANTMEMLQSIKNSYPKFPVYRTYHLLKGKSKGEFKDLIYPDLDNSADIINGITDIINANPECLAWTDKYKATTTNHLIGNFDAIKEIKKWLTNWTETEIKPKSSNVDSDLSDFYVSDNDSNDIKGINNLLILTGPTGSGKTSCIYAVASELAIKVIEVNVSSRRTGKSMLQDLQEATQSHKVNRGNSSSENSQKSQDVTDDNLFKTIKKRGRPPKNVDNKTDKNSKKEILSKKQSNTEKREVLSQPTSSQEATRTGMSLILIDDADIVFDQDDGFTSAIAQLIQISKRPVILITSSYNCQHLQKFMQCGKILNMRPFLPKMLGTWLDILCLADGGLAKPGLGAKCLDMFRGDIRKCLNHLQFYITSQKLKCSLDEVDASQNIDTYKPFLEDETSSMSWACEGSEDRNLGKTLLSEVKDDHIFGTQLFTDSLEVFNIWWSIPNLFPAIFKKDTMDKTVSRSKKEIVDELQTLAKLTDTMSVADYLSSKKPRNNSDITTPPWKCFETDSVSELENFGSFCKSYDTRIDLIQDLVSSSIVHAQNTVRVENKTDIYGPGRSIIREKDRVISRHENLDNFLNPSTRLDRKAMALDYWSTCRAICRIEKGKTDTVLKRNNRFYHYLKCFSSSCKSDALDKLGESLSWSKGTDDA